MDIWQTYSGLGIWTTVVLFLLYGCYISYKEKEPRAAHILLATSITLFTLILGLHFISPAATRVTAGSTILITAFLCLYRYKPVDVQKPNKRFDERDVIFSRFKLLEGSSRFENYYRGRNDLLDIDNQIRTLPGLLKQGSLYYDRELFDLAKSNFSKIEKLHPEVDGIPCSQKTEVNTEELTNSLKNLAIDLGAHSAGIATLENYHLYTNKGRGDRYGEEITKTHSYALAFTVEMDFENVGSAPAAPIVVESSKQYLESGIIAIKLAQKIREMGYEAKAHVDGNYELICPLVARDAGLGEIGRMGLLMTPNLGPRCRIAVVTTTLPLIADAYTPDPSVIHFCEKCKKCADTCPGQAIPTQARKGVSGHKRWKIDHAACFQLWCKAGTDCGRCMAVCPYSHPNNPLHNIVRFMIRRFPIYASIALKMDDILYGRRPKPKPVQKKLKQANS